MPGLETHVFGAALRPLSPVVELLEEGGPAAGEAWSVTLTGERTFVLGRGHGCDVRFCPIRHRRVSLRHAAISIEGAAVTVRDLDSRNGTWLNGNRLADTAPLVDGDTITLGWGGPVLRVTVYEGE